MDELLCAEEAYPDFSLLEEALLPPCFDPDQTCGHLDEEWSKLLLELQYCQQPHGVAVVHREFGSAAQRIQSVEGKLQYRRKASRGRRRRYPGRVSEEKAKKWSHSNNCEYSEHKMSCMMPVLKPTVFHLLEESVRQLEKCIDTQNNDQCVCNTTGDHNQTYPRDSFKIVRSPSNISSNALEILNHINMECALINKLGQGAEGHLLKESECQDGCYLEINNNIPRLDRACLSSTSEEQDVYSSVDPKWLSSCDCGLEKYPFSTSCEVQHVKKTKERNQGNSSDGPSNNRVYVQRTLRKQRTPMKSVEKMDPSFQGIEFQMRLCFAKEKCDDCQLIVTSIYSRGRNQRKRTKSRLRFKSTSLSSGSDDDHTSAASSKIKRCASCKTQKTPLWRDAEDGTPLCNACGIRYKKYGVRCGECWTIPKKDGKTCSRYCGCGGMFIALI